MGWAGGSELFEDVWKEVRRFIPEDDLVPVCAEVIGAFENFDCDTLDEVVYGHPEWWEVAEALDIDLESQWDADEQSALDDLIAEEEELFSDGGEEEDEE
jgi:hypothetical protein